MKFKLRPYQLQAVDAALDYFNGKNKSPVIEVMPTGAGKSLVIAGIASKLTGSTLVFQPTKEILEQNVKKVMNCGVTDLGVFSASAGMKAINRITYATIGSVINKMELFEHFDNVIIDECHFVNSKAGMYNKFLTGGKFKILGLTATPYRLTTDGYGGSIMKFLTRTRPRIFSKVIHITQNHELFDSGYLSKLQYFKYKQFDTTAIELNSTGADYADNSVKQYYKEIGFEDRIIDVIKKCIHEGRKNILVFTRFIKEAQYIVDNMNGVAEIVTGTTKKKDREGVIDRFRSGQTQVVANVGVLSIGFDFPELETIVLARPTRSLALYYQMIGRGIRISPDKSEAWVIDMCNSYDRFGSVEDLKIIDSAKSDQSYTAICPRCNKSSSVIRDKFKGGWFCWKKKDGCGTHFNKLTKAPNDTKSSKSSVIFIVSSNGRQLTNIYYDNIDQADESNLIDFDDDIPSGFKCENKSVHAGQQSLLA